ncbi:MAG: serine/threonine protein kinase [Planctomycetes bacterium]|nr:serine/threonine protein kinase [Planctomycetota bacterium]
MSWQRVRTEFERLCDLPRAAADAALAELATTDRWLADQVRDLLAQDAAAPGFLERDAAPRGAGAAVAAAGLRLGRFELVRPLGAGGMGAVWEARQSDPERRVAIKLVVRDGRSERERWRFLHEVQLLAQLRHPAIATLYEAGEDSVGGTPVSWFAMELVEGGKDLLTWAREQRLPRAARLALFEQLCEAVDHGHRHGVLHRDIKPGNVLVDRDGRLQLIDFGVARALGDAAAVGPHTAAGEVVGTLQYMAPEQLRGDSAAIGTPADVYALGVVLYHLLCERPPFDLDGVPLPRIAAIVLEREPPPPHQVADVPVDLGWIVLRALAKDPAQRYRTPRDLIDDLRRWQRHEPVLARAPGLGYRLRKYARRHRVAVGVAAILLVGLGVGFATLVEGLRAARAGERSARRGEQLSREVARVTIAMFDAIRDDQRSRDLKVHELLDASALPADGSIEPAVEFAWRDLRGRIYARLRRFDAAQEEFAAALPLLDAALADEADAALRERKRVLFDARFGRALASSGEVPRGEAMLEAAGQRAAAFGEDVQVEVLQETCHWLWQGNRFAELRAKAADLRRRAERLAQPEVVLAALSYEADATLGLGEHDAAVELATAVHSAAVAQHGADSPRACQALADRVQALHEASRLDDVEALYPELIELTRRVYGPQHDNTLVALSNHAMLLQQRGRHDAAMAAMRDVLAVHDARGGPPSEQLMSLVNNLGMMLNQRRRFDEAEPLLRRAGELATRVLDARDPNGPLIRFNHGACLAWMKRWREAEPILLREYEAAQALLPADHPVWKKLRRTLADAYAQNGDEARAAEWRQ